MKYLLALIGDESRWGEVTPEQQAESMKAWDALHERELIDAGAYLGGEGLQPSATATTVGSRESGDPRCSDGPFAETKEQLGGYYLLDCDDLDDALAWAKRDPDARRHGRGAAGHGLRGAPAPRRTRTRRRPRGRPAAEDVDRLFRRESGRAVATLIRVLGDFDLAEEAVQDAFVVALERWPRDGVPRNPARLDRHAPPATGRSTRSGATAATSRSSGS